MLKILFASSEVYPLIKTGGLADVSSSLPKALQGLGHQLRVVLPAYPAVMAACEDTGRMALLRFELRGHAVTLWQTRLPGSRVAVWLVDAPDFFDRPGNPYLDASGHDWPDNAERFAFFSRVVCRLALNQAGLHWAPDVVHCNDWQTGLVPALLSLEASRPATVFTIHNLAYRGLFPAATFQQLGLPAQLWHFEALEFHQQLALIKGGLVYADLVTTVSPSYAKEIQTPEGGCGLDGLLRHRQTSVHGVLNGIDTQEWNPASDPHLPVHYNWQRLDGKARCKRQLQKQFGFPLQSRKPLLGMICRLVEQKGVDLVLAALPALLAKNRCQMVVLGSGDAWAENQLRALAERFPESLSVTIGYNETLAHQIEAAADLFLMPSRFEPCGLNQLYSLRYGSLPVVRAVGGLKDTVIDVDADSEDGNGFVFEESSGAALGATLERALAWYRRKDDWKKRQRSAMRKNVSWGLSAQAYTDLYLSIVRPAPTLSTPPPVSKAAKT